ncbi:hypothetical protein K438DRAFT_1983882 [Mycena galopus ATCC 62051]|nr:hypothetical protein K438DRAFT_1983882 [Mycena galopus ATCC 62051]
MASAMPHIPPSSDTIRLESTIKGSYPSLPIGSTPFNEFDLFSAPIPSVNENSDFLAPSASPETDFIPIVPFGGDHWSFDLELYKSPTFLQRQTIAVQNIRRNPQRRSQRATSALEVVTHIGPAQCESARKSTKGRTTLPSVGGRQGAETSSGPHSLYRAKASTTEASEKGLFRRLWVRRTGYGAGPKINNDPKSLIWASESLSIGTDHSQYGVPPPYMAFPPSNLSL